MYLIFLLPTKVFRIRRVQLKVEINFNNMVQVYSICQARGGGGAAIHVAIRGEIELLGTRRQSDPLSSKSHDIREALIGSRDSNVCYLTVWMLQRFE